MGTISEQQFLASLEQETPAVELPPLLQAIRHGLRGEWEPAHRIAQTVDDADGAWVHAWLHRVEGDLAQRRLLVPPRRQTGGDGEHRCRRTDDRPRAAGAVNCGHGSIGTLHKKRAAVSRGPRCDRSVSEAW